MHVDSVFFAPNPSSKRSVGENRPLEIMMFVVDVVPKAFGVWVDLNRNCAVGLETRAA